MKTEIDILKIFTEISLNQTESAELSLTNGKLPAQHLLPLFILLSSNTTISEVDISGNDLTDAGFTESEKLTLTTHLGNNPNLTKINISKNKLSNEFIQLFLANLRHNQQSTIQLDISSDVPISFDCVLQFAELMAFEKKRERFTLETLKMTNPMLKVVGKNPQENLESVLASSPKTFQLLKQKMPKFAELLKQPNLLAEKEILINDTIRTEILAYKDFINTTYFADLAQEIVLEMPNYLEKPKEVLVDTNVILELQEFCFKLVLCERLYDALSKSENIRVFEIDRGFLAKPFENMIDNLINANIKFHKKDMKKYQIQRFYSDSQSQNDPQDDELTLPFIHLDADDLRVLATTENRHGAEIIAGKPISFPEIMQGVIKYIKEFVTDIGRGGWDDPLTQQPYEASKTPEEKHRIFDKFNIPKQLSLFLRGSIFSMAGLGVAALVDILSKWSNPPISIAGKARSRVKKTDNENMILIQEVFHISKILPTPNHDEIEDIKKVYFEEKKSSERSLSREASPMLIVTQYAVEFDKKTKTVSVVSYSVTCLLAKFAHVTLVEDLFEAANTPEYFAYLSADQLVKNLKRLSELKNTVSPGYHRKKAITLALDSLAEKLSQPVLSDKEIRQWILKLPACFRTEFIQTLATYDIKIIGNIPLEDGSRVYQTQAKLAWNEECDLFAKEIKSLKISKKQLTEPLPMKYENNYYILAIDSERNYYIEQFINELYLRIIGHAAPYSTVLPVNLADGSSCLVQVTKAVALQTQSLDQLASDQGLENVFAQLERKELSQFILMALILGRSKFDARNIQLESTVYQNSEYSKLSLFSLYNQNGCFQQLPENSHCFDLIALTAGLKFDHQAIEDILLLSPEEVLLACLNDNIKQSLSDHYHRTVTTIYFRLYQLQNLLRKNAQSTVAEMASLLSEKSTNKYLEQYRQVTGFPVWTSEYSVNLYAEGKKYELEAIVNFKKEIDWRINDIRQGKTDKLSEWNELQIESVFNELDFNDLLVSLEIQANTESKILQALLSSGKSLRRLRLNNCHLLNDETFTDLLQSLPTLELLEIVGSEQMTADLINMIAKCCPNLSALTISHCASLETLTISDLAGWNKLKQLQIDQCDRLVAVDINCPSLNFLQITRCADISMLNLVTPSLYALYFNQCSAVNLEMATLRDTLKNCSQLRLLDLSDNRLNNFSAVYLPAALREMPKLRWLNLSRNNMGSDMLSFVPPLKTLKKLEYINISDNKLETDVMVEFCRIISSDDCLLNTVDLGYDGVDNKFLEVMWIHLKENTSIITLALSRFNMPKECLSLLDRLDVMLERNQQAVQSLSSRGEAKLLTSPVSFFGQANRAAPSDEDGSTAKPRSPGHN